MSVFTILFFFVLITHVNAIVTKCGPPMTIISDSNGTISDGAFNKANKDCSFQITAPSNDLQIVVNFTSFYMYSTNYFTAVSSGMIANISGLNKSPRIYNTPGSSLTLTFHYGNTMPFTFTANYYFIPVLNSSISCPSAMVSNVIELGGGRVDFKSIPPTPASRTWAFWWLTPSVVVNELLSTARILNSGVVSIADPPSVANGFSTCSDANQWLLGFDDPGMLPRNQFIWSQCSSSLATGSVTNYDQWNHWAVTYNATTQVIQFFQNGAVIATQNVAIATTTSGKFSVGFSFENWVHSRGYLAELQVWNRDLSPLEIKTIIASPAAITSGLVGHWSGNYSGNQLLDLSPMGNTGTLLNAGVIACIPVLPTTTTTSTSTSSSTSSTISTSSSTITTSSAVASTTSSIVTSTTSVTTSSTSTSGTSASASTSITNISTSSTSNDLSTSTGISSSDSVASTSSSSILSSTASIGSSTSMFSNDSSTTTSSSSSTSTSSGSSSSSTGTSTIEPTSSTSTSSTSTYGNDLGTSTGCTSTLSGSSSSSTGTSATEPTSSTSTSSASTYDNNSSTTTSSSSSTSTLSGSSSSSTGTSTIEPTSSTSTSSASTYDNDLGTSTGSDSTFITSITSSSTTYSDIGTSSDVITSSSSTSTSDFSSTTSISTGTSSSSSTSALSSSSISTTSYSSSSSSTAISTTVATSSTSGITSGSSSSITSSSISSTTESTAVSSAVGGTTADSTKQMDTTTSLTTSTYSATLATVSTTVSTAYSNSSAANTQISSKTAFSNTVIVVLVAAIGTIVLIALSIGLFFILRRYRKSSGVLPTENPIHPTLRESYNPSQNSSYRGTIDISTGKKIAAQLKMVEVKNKIGSGSFGDVYRGYWQGTEVALKKLQNNERSMEIMEEAVTLCALNHPNIVRFYGLATKDEYTYIVMEYLSKGSVLDLLRKMGQKLELRTLFQIIHTTARGMAYLESESVLHLDLACRNLLVSVVDEHYQAKIADFGLAQVTNDHRNQANKPIPIRWSAPEILRKLTVTSKSDVFSFGVVVWEILERGKVPYSGMTNDQVVLHILNGGRLPEPENVPTQLMDLIERCMHNDPSKRPSFAKIVEILGDLETELCGTQIVPITRSKTTDHVYETMAHPVQLVEKFPVNHYCSMPQFKP